MIIAFAAYLNNCKLHGRRLTFEEWVISRPDVSAAREFIHQNPAGALAPLPPVIPSVLSSASNGGGIGTSGDGHTITSLQPSSATKAGGKPGVTAAREVAVSQEEERSVLLRRRGSTVGRRSILKSLTFNAGSSSSSTSLFNNQRTAVAVAALGGGPPSTPPPTTINPTPIMSTSPVIAIPSPGIAIPSLSLPVQGNTAVAKHTDRPPINTTIATTTNGTGAITITDSNNSKPTGSSLLPISGIADIRCAQDLPIYTVGNATVEGLCSLLSSLGAGPISLSSREGEGGDGDGDMHDTITITTNNNYHVIVTDLREELVLYINGTAFIRRELEMPAAALHHAGIQATRLEDLERRLLADVAAEAEGWGGKVLLHREVVVLPTGNSANNGGGNNNNNGGSSSHTAVPPPSHQGAEMVPPVSPALGGLFSPGPSPHIDSTTSPKDKKDEKEEEEEEDITQTTEAQEKTKPAVQVVAFWEPVVVPLPSSSLGTTTTTTNTVGLATAFDVFQHLIKAGYQVSYRRVPMSRERTPQASDLEQVLSQMAAVPPGKRPIYIFLSRTATGSSVRFATAAAATYIKWREAVEVRALEMAHYNNDNGGGSSSNGNGNINSGGGLNVGSSSFSAGASPAGSSWGRNTGFAAARGARTGGTSEGILSAEPSEDGGGGGGPSSTRHTSHHPMRTSLQLPRTDSDVSELMRNVPAGEYRGIMNLCRVLPSGGEAKAAVDAAIEGSVAKSIGNLITDIYACKQATEEERMTVGSSGGMSGSGMEAYFEKRYAARRLGIHYLKRYAFLIMFRVYLDKGLESGVNFTRFYEERRELKHLLSTLDLE
jgi:hypothetical protein